MATTTSNQGIPIPSESDDPDVPSDMAALAGFVEHQIIGIYATTADRDSRATSPKEGQFAFVKADDTLWFWTGTNWAQFHSAGGDAPNITVSSSAPTGGADGDIWFKV